MRNRVVRLVFVLLMLALLTVFALGPAGAGVACRLLDHPAGVVETWDGLDGLWADPFAGGSSGT